MLNRWDKSRSGETPTTASFFNALSLGILDNMLYSFELAAVVIVSGNLFFQRILTSNFNVNSQLYYPAALILGGDS